MTFFANGWISRIFFVMYVYSINETLGHKFHPSSFNLEKGAATKALFKLQFHKIGLIHIGFLVTLM